MGYAFFDKLIRSSVGTNYRPAKVAPGTSTIQLNRHMHNQNQKKFSETRKLVVHLVNEHWIRS